MSLPPGVFSSRFLSRLTLTVVLLVSTTGDSPFTVTSSFTVLTFIVNSSVMVWLCRSTTFSREIVWNPWSAILTVYVPTG